MSARTLVIIPTFNERDNIASLVERLLKLYDFADVLVVDDGSPDGTANIIEELQSSYDGRLFLLQRTGKGGRGSAVMAGFEYALEHDYDYIVEMDADFSHKPEEIESFFSKIDDTDIVVGSRYLPGSEIHDWGWKRTFFSKFANFYAATILRLPITDYTNGFRLYTRRAIEALDPSTIDAKGYVVLSEVAYQLHHKGMQLDDAPTVFVNRRRGESNLSLHEVHEAFISVLRIRYPRAAKHVAQGLKFGMCGIGGAVIDFGLSALLVSRGVPDRVAVVASVLPAMIFVFFANKYFTFKGTSNAAAGAQLFKFLIVYGAAFLINSGSSILFIGLGLHYILAKACAIAVVATWNYCLMHRFVFRGE